VPSPNRFYLEIAPLRSRYSIYPRIRSYQRNSRWPSRSERT